MGDDRDKKLLMNWFEKAIEKVPLLKYAWTFLLMLTVLVLADVFKKTAQEIFMWSVGALAFCVVFTVLQKRISKEDHFNKQIARVAIVFSLLFFILLLSLLAITFFSRKGKLTNLVVTVYDARRGKSQLFSLGQGDVVVKINGESKNGQIDKKGQAHFMNIPIGSKVYINVDSCPYTSIWPDSLFYIESDAVIDILVKLQNVDVIRGNVRSVLGSLEGVRASFGPIVTFSDSLGNFTLNIPDSLQRKEYTIWLQKDGYGSTAWTSTPQTGEQLEAVLVKTK